MSKKNRKTPPMSYEEFEFRFDTDQKFANAKMAEAITGLVREHKQIIKVLKLLSQRLTMAEDWINAIEKERRGC